MENSYGIGVANRYALFLDDESDPLESLSIKEQEKEPKKKTTKTAEKENVKGKNEQPKAKTAVPNQKKPVKEPASNKAPEIKREDNKANNQRANTDGKPERTNKFNNESREERNNRRNREDRPERPPYNGPSENRDRDRENRPRRDNAEGFDNRNRDRGERGERRERGERGERGPPGTRSAGPRGGGVPRKFDDRRGKREFDRQSGSDKTPGYSGVKPIEKRDGSGPHNWGSHKDLIEAETDATTNPPAAEADQSWGENNEKPETVVPNDVEKKDEPEAEATPVEEEPKEMTLDEWKAQRAGRAKPTYNLRKAGEGEDPSQWKKMFELKKKEDEEVSKEAENTDDEEYETMDYPQRVGRQKHVLDIDIQFNDYRRLGGGGTRGGRGQRSGFRGAGGRGGRDGGRGDREGGRGDREGGRGDREGGRGDREGGRGDREGGRGDREGGRGDREFREGGRGDREFREGGRGDREYREGGRADREEGRGEREGGRGDREGGRGGREGGRGDREGGRPSRDGGGDRRAEREDDKSAPKAPKVDDERDFPSLG